MISQFATLAAILSALPIAVFGNLAVSGKSFAYNGQQVFLSGLNLSPNWDYRNFGYGAYRRVIMEGWLTHIATAGGNAARVWLHVDGEDSPVFDNSGHANGNDTDSMIAELAQFLDVAHKNGIFVIITLWNGPTEDNDNLIKLFKENASLQAYIDKVLTPMAKALAAKIALASWEIINYASDMVTEGIADANKCFDTKNLTRMNAHSTRPALTMKEVLNFINKQAAAIKTASPGVLVTSGVWSETVNTDACVQCFNYYKDECLIAAGGKSNGVLDYYRINSFIDKYGNYSEYSVLKRKAADLALDKPILIGDFSNCEESKNVSNFYKHAYNDGYGGILWWQFDKDIYYESGVCSDKKAAQDQGMAAIRDMTTNGKIRVNNIFDI